jgi:acetolactate synthase-1/2/3 large subunit
MMHNKSESVAEYYAQFIADREATAVFHLSGGMIAFLTDAIAQLGKTPLITNRNEQASGFAAEGATRVSGKPSVAMGTSGPGATNLVTAIASCYFDSSPVIFITGQVNTLELRSSKIQRQNGFQELDISSLVQGITKATFTPMNSSEATLAIHKAWRIAVEGRPGPVLIDLPIDIQQEFVDSEPMIPLAEPFKESDEISDELFTAINELFSKAKQPLILLGGGARLDSASKDLQKFVFDTQIPVVTSLMGLDVGSFAENQYLGFIGSYGNRWANDALHRSDLLLVLGSRLDPRQTGPSIQTFRDGKKIIRVDIDQSELDGRVNADIKVKSSVSYFLRDSRLNVRKFSENTLRTDSLTLKISKPQSSEQESEIDLNPNKLMESLSTHHPEAAGYVVDVGQHQMWAAQSLKLNPSQRFITSGGLGSMGFSLPAAIGAAIAVKSEWVVLLGDGCAQLSAPELQTIAELNLPIKIYVINNGQHGMVAQFQDEYMDSRYIGTKVGYTTPDFCALANAYGISNTLNLKSDHDLKTLSDFLLESKGKPALINVHISSKAKALPKLRFNDPNVITE